MTERVGGKDLKPELWQQDDETIEIFLDRAVRRLTTSGIIPMSDDVKDSPQYEREIQSAAEELFEDEN